MTRRWIAILAIPAALCAGHATADDRADTPAALAGDYVHSQMELAAGIRLKPDGTFEYGLTVGSLDESARGRWTVDGKRIELTSVPRPVAPTITAGPVETAPGQPFAIRVVGPNGRDVPGIDFTIEFDSGDPLRDYVPGGPWSLPAAERRTPRFIRFEKRSYRIRSERLPLDAAAGRVATFVLTPNDFGVVDLTGVPAEIDGKTLTLHRAEGTMSFRRAER